MCIFLYLPMAFRLGLWRWNPNAQTQGLPSCDGSQYYRRQIQITFKTHVAQKVESSNVIGLAKSAVCLMSCGAKWLLCGALTQINSDAANDEEGGGTTWIEWVPNGPLANGLEPEYQGVMRRGLCLSAGWNKIRFSKYYVTNAIKTCL